MIYLLNIVLNAGNHYCLEIGKNNFVHMIVNGKINYQQKNNNKHVQKNIGVKSNLCLIDSKFNFSNPEFREYCKKKVVEKYGIDNVFKLPEIKEKIKQTNLERYGNAIPAKTDIIQAKSKNSCLEKYRI